ncbi:MAG: hypothetical protein ACPG4O_09265 [bacterium]
MKKVINVIYSNKKQQLPTFAFSKDPENYYKSEINKMEKMNKGKMPAEIGKLFGLLYDGESELLVRIASENLKKQQTQQDGQNQEIDSEESINTTDPLKP